MNHSNHTTNNKKSKYLNEQDRYQIEALEKAGFSNTKIAEQIGPMW